MFDYPPQLPFDKLESTCSTYDALYPTWSQINDLRIGGWFLESKKRQYIPQRPDEPLDLYEHRLSKFVYTNVFGDSIKDYAIKITNAPITVQGCDSDDWMKFRRSTDGKNRNERKLLNKLFQNLVAFGTSWVLIDKPSNNGVTPRNKAEEELLGLDTPYTVLYKPLNVTSWQFDDRGRVRFAKIRQSVEDSHPFASTPKTRLVWTFVDDTYITKYSCYVHRTLDGTLTPTTSFDRDDVTDSRYIADNKTLAVNKVSQVAHGMPTAPIVYCELDNTLWCGNAAYLKAKQHLLIETGYTDTASYAGHIQKVFTPSPRPPDSVDVSYTDEVEELKKLKASNQHLLIGQGFQFAEASGTSLKTLRQDVLAEIELQIKSIVSLSNVSAVTSSTGIDRQSGVSKSIDYTQVNEAMKQYGAELCIWYREILQHVGYAFGLSGKDISDIEVSGLNTFGVNTVNELVSLSEKVTKFQDNLPETVKRHWWGKVGESMTGALPPQIEQTIERELNSLDFKGSSDEPPAATQ